MVIQASAAAPLFIPTFSCSFTQLLASIHTSNAVPDKTTSRKLPCAQTFCLREKGTSEQRDAR